MQMKIRAACIAAALVLSAHARADSPPGNPNATLIYFDAVSNQTLDPQEPQNNSSFSQGVLMAVYEALTQLDEAGNPRPGLAQSWEYSPDLTVFTMHLRPGVKFHDGTKFDAAAVVRNLERSAALGNKAGAATIETTAQIVAIETDGDSIVRLRLKAPSGQMPYLLGFQAGMMISPASLTENVFGAALKPIGAGPYQVKSFESNVRTIMTRNDSYWGGIEGRPAGFEHHFVPEARARLNAVRSGQANIALIEARQIAEAKAAGFTVQINEKNSTWEIQTNNTREQVGKLKVRQAMMHAIDRQALADGLGYGASKATSQFFASSSPAYVPALDTMYPYDQDKARKLLAEAGYPNGVDVTWLLLNTNEYKQIGEAVQSMLGEVGIRIKFDIIDVSQYYTFRRPPQRGDILMVRWGGRPDPLQSFQESSGGNSVPWGAVTPEIDKLIDQARGMVPTDPRRLQVLHELARVTTEQVSHITLMTRSAIYAYKPGCIINLPPYLATGNDRINDTRVGANCK
jgi:peptide/nickel transport system substrate-binding protein